MSDDDPAADPETVFEMDPERTMVTLARHLVDGQRSLAQLRRQTQASAEHALDPEQGAKVIADFAHLEQQWFRETLPNTVAAFQMALEVLDTFGPGYTRIEDPMDAVS